MCYEAGSLGAMRMGKHRYTFSTERQNCKIGPYGDTSEKQEITEKNKVGKL